MPIEYSTIKYFTSRLSYPMRGMLIPPDPEFKIVLIEPEIPQNTGNIARLCVATGSSLHIIGRPGFSLSEKMVRRAGLDYWPKLKIFRHDDLIQFKKSNPYSKLYYITTRTDKSYFDIKFSPGDAVVFGKESVGLPEELIEANYDNCYGIPITSDVRSLNIANAVSIVLFEALRQVTK